MLLVKVYLMSGNSALRRLHGARRQYEVPEPIFRAILVGQIGQHSAKGISQGGVDRCIEEFKKHNPAAIPKKEGKPRDWRPASKSAHIRKVHALWGILRRGGIVTERYPDKFVFKLTGVSSTEFLIPKDANIMIDASIAWIKDEGLGHELK